MNNRPRAVTTIMHVVQISFAFGIEWDRWEDMLGGGDADLYETLAKMELFHHFMEHGCYPEPYASTPAAIAAALEMDTIRKVLLVVKSRANFKSRTRIVRRTVVSTITDEEVDSAMLVNHGEKK